MSISYRTPMDRNLIAYDESGQKPIGTIEKGAASQFLGWGSYSGADIKVVVHYPIDKRAQQALYDDKLYYEKQLGDINNKIISYEAAGTEQGTIISLRDDVFERDAIQGVLSDIDSEISYLSGIPTSRVLAELQTISYSVYREKSPVRTLGSVYPRAYVRGPRTIGGSMIFTVFHQHVLHEILDLNLKFYNTGTSDHDKYTYTTNLPDQLPPLDISLVFANEYGALSHMGIYGVEFMQEGSTFSIEDIFTENVVQYVARDMDPMRLVDKRQVDGQGIKEEWTLTASSLLLDNQYRNNPLVRRNQFI
jgi:hypothetical protein